MKFGEKLFLTYYKITDIIQNNIKIYLLCITYKSMFFKLFDK